MIKGLHNETHFRRRNAQILAVERFLPSQPYFSSNMKLKIDFKVYLDFHGHKHWYNDNIT